MFADLVCNSVTTRGNQSAGATRETRGSQTYSSITVIARHSMMAGCDGGSLGMPDSGFGYRDASRAPGRNERTPRSSNRPPAVKVSSTRLPRCLWCNLTIPVLRQPSHILDTLDLPSQHLLDRLDQAVCDPACELVEWHELVALGVGARGDALLFEGVTRPDIA